MSLLLSPLTLRGTTLRNRIAVAPMCQYSSVDGMPADWHLVHLGARAVGGAGLVLTEAAAVSPEGRISPDDVGIWDDAQARAWARVVAFVKEQGAAAGVQLAHAGRKASTYRPWHERRGSVPVEEGGWQTVGPSAVPFGRYAVPLELDEPGMAQVVEDFARAAGRAVEAGFDVVELHAAHGYLLHSFCSPLSNHRTDSWGGSFANRVRLPLAVVDAVRAVLPESVPLLYRVSATDWVDGGWTLQESVELSLLLADRGVDLVDCSSGGLAPEQVIDVRPGYQVPFARAVRDAGVPSGAVGLLTDARQCEQVLADGDADLVLLARELLRDPHWPLRAAHELGVEGPWPAQYERARW